MRKESRSAEFQSYAIMIAMALAWVARLVYFLVNDPMQALGFLGATIATIVPVFAITWLIMRMS